MLALHKLRDHNQPLIIRLHTRGSDDDDSALDLLFA